MKKTGMYRYYYLLLVGSLFLSNLPAVAAPASGLDSVKHEPAVSDSLAEPKPLPIPSSRAQTLYSAARDDLLQIRVLLKNGRTQSSVGSGFLIGTSNLVVTNYHVVSQIALEPEVYLGEYVDTHGERGSVELLMVDALHDLAVVRVGRRGTGYFNLAPRSPVLTQGQYLYSLGNPLDLGFAISEGSYNGIIGRGFYDQLMFTGPINAGMSGGPNITEDGQIAGVNVSKRLDGELVSFLVPVDYVRALLAKVAGLQANTSKKIPVDFKKIVGEQLLQHQSVMVDQVLKTPFSLKTLGPYQVPVRESDQVRCWGRSNNGQDKAFILNNIDCAMESAVYVSDQLQIGNISLRHEFTKSTDLGAIRFASLMSASFKNETFGNHKNPNLTGPECKEQFVVNQDLSGNKGLPMRAVLCVRGYRKFEGLYNFSLLVATTDESLVSLQSRIDANGVSFENGTRITRNFIEAIARRPKSLNVKQNGLPGAKVSEAGKGSKP